MPKVKSTAKQAAKEVGSKKKIAVKKLGSKTKIAKKTAPAEGGMKRKFKVKAGTNALREIKRYQKSLDNLLPRAPFQRLVREISKDCSGPDMRFQSQALVAL
jgi:histone H3